MRSCSRADLARLWSNLGVASGDLVMCHSFLPSLGLVEGGARSVISTLLEAIGERGNLVVPAFTYSYFRNEIFDWHLSPSTVGVLGDVARAEPGAVRSLDPAFSMACIGPDAESLMRRESPNSFGPGSIYERLHESGLRILLLGVDFTAMSLFMHLERLIGVHYRYDKRFEGLTRKDGRIFEDAVVHFVRDLDIDFVNDRTDTGRELEADPRCHHARLGFGRHILMDGKSIEEVVRRRVARDPFALVRHPARAP